MPTLALQAEECGGVLAVLPQAEEGSTKNTPERAGLSANAYGAKAVEMMESMHAITHSRIVSGLSHAWP